MYMNLQGLGGPPALSKGFSKGSICPGKCRKNRSESESFMFVEVVNAAPSVCLCSLTLLIKYNCCPTFFVNKQYQFNLRMATSTFPSNCTLEINRKYEVLLWSFMCSLLRVNVWKRIFHLDNSFPGRAPFLAENIRNVTP